MPSSKTFNLTDQTNAFKINYYKRSQNMYNSENLLQGRMKKKYDFTGKRRDVNTPLSFSGGVGANKLPLSNAGIEGLATITSHKVYATCSVEREAIYASQNDAGAFVKATALTVKKTVESHMRNASRILFGDGHGILGKGDGTGVNVAAIAGGYQVAIPASQAKEVNWEEKDFVQVVSTLAADNSGGTPEGGVDLTTNLLEVSSVAIANTGIITLQLLGTSAILTAGIGAPLAATVGFSMQRSYDKEPMGLGGALSATSGTLYNLTIQRRWQAYQKDAASAGVTPDIVNNAFLQVHKKFGEYPNLIVAGYEQYQNMLALMEDQKRYAIDNRNIGKAKMSFEGVEWMTPKGPVGVFLDRFMDKDKIFLLNDNYIEVHHRPGFGWMEDDGTMFLRDADEDQYSARYGGYYENFIIPTAHAVISNLAI